MSTRALYSFFGEEGNFNVYKHHDGYASGAARTIKMAIDVFAWKLPRYESDAFACAFIAAGKFGSWVESQERLIEWYKTYGPKGTSPNALGGGVRLLPQGNPTEIAHQHCNDIAYRYEIRMGTPMPGHIEARARKKLSTPVLLIKQFDGSWWQNKDAYEKEIFSGPFTDFYKEAIKADEAA